MQDFDKAFDDFLEGDECEGASDALYTAMRAAFTAGWLSAGGKAPPARKVIEVIRTRHQEPCN